MKIGFDMDGVLSDFDSEFRKRIEEKFKIKANDGEPRVWNYYNWVTGLTKEMEDSIVADIIKTPFFWIGLAAIDEKIMFQIAERSFTQNIYFITNRYPNPTEEKTILQTRRWLLNMDIEAAGVISTKDKPAACRLLRLDYFIDDYGPSVSAINANSQTKCYLLKRSYNSNYDSPYKVDTVQEYLNITNQ
jgi:uncharacterized HAD superfamily protein